MKKGIRKPKTIGETINQEIAQHGMLEQLIECEYQKQKLDQKAFDIQTALGMTVEPVETISLGYDIPLSGFMVPIGHIMEIYRQMDDYVCSEEPNELSEEIRKTRESLRKDILEQITDLMHRASDQANQIKRKYQKEN